MAVVRCLGCGEAFEAMGTTVACPVCGTIMRVSGTGASTPPGLGSRAGRAAVRQTAEVEILTPEAMGMPVTERGSRKREGGPWLTDGMKMWGGLIVGVIVFALFIDWFRMRITPAKTVVDQTKVEKLAHEIAEERINELALKLEKMEAATRRATPPAVTADLSAPVAGTTPAPTVGANPPITPATPQTALATPVEGTTARPGNSTTTVSRAGGRSATATLATSRPVRNPLYASLASLAPVRPTNLEGGDVSDAQIDASLKKGLDWLIDQFSRTRLKSVEQYGPDIFGGANAIGVYAALMAGQAIRDERVGPTTPLVKGLLDGLKEIPIEGGKDTYGRSLRLSALTVYNRKEDRPIIESDVRWLLESSIQGAFTYSKPPPNVQRESTQWDNSNSQYGGLGLWAAAEAGYRVPTQVWKDIENHWVSSQVKVSGGWGYQGDRGPATVAMTAAGATMLMVARDQMMVEGATQANLAAPLGKPLERALEWLDEGEHTVNFGGHYGYTLYGLERIGLASGYKYFGKYDWYRSLAKKAVESQQKDGSWPGGDTQVSEAAFHLLFLARGREPVFMGKLRWEGNWTNRPRDVAGLTRFASRAMERSMNWQVLGAQREWTDWTDAPVMLVTSNEAPKLTDAEVEKLRSYVLAGGLVFTHAEDGSAAFNTFAADLAKRMFPEYPMTPLPAGHAVYTAMFPLQNAPVLSGVSNGSRLLMVHAASDLSKQWGVRPAMTDRERSRGTAAAELGVNVVVHATGKRDLRRRTDPLYVPERQEKPVGVIPVARLRYDGNWDPEPWGWVRAGRKLDRDTSIGLEIKPTDIVALEPGTAPLAHLTGTATVSFGDADVKVIREYVKAGGVILVDACGGSAAFAESARAGLIARAFPDATATVVGSGHPIMGRGKSLMAEVERLLTRGDGTGQAAGLRVISAGKGAVVFTDLDLSTGLLGTTVSGVRGYEPTVAERLVRNVIVWAVWPEGAPEVRGAKAE